MYMAHTHDTHRCTHTHMDTTKKGKKGLITSANSITTQWVLIQRQKVQRQQAIWDSLIGVGQRDQGAWAVRVCEQMRLAACGPV